MNKKSSIRRLAVMGKLITLGFSYYLACDNKFLRECVLNETQVEGIDNIRTEMRMFHRQKEVAFQDLANEKDEDVKISLNIFKRDLKHLEKYLKLCKEGHSKIKKSLFEPLKDYIVEVQETIEDLQPFVQ